MTRGAGSSIYRIGNRRELFIDDFLIDKLDGAWLELHSPRPAETVFYFDQPWEGASSAYVTALQDGNRFLVYYRAAPYKGYPQVTCLAESGDGISWIRPSLGINSFNGSRDNNIVWVGKGSHNFSPFLDINPAAPAGQRYKALAGEPPLALCSADGIRWHALDDEPALTRGEFDSQNVAFWDGQRECYAAYIRIYSQGGRRGLRSIARSTSSDFVHWTEPELIDTGPAQPEHLYTSAVTPYFRAPHILVAFPMRLIPERQVIHDHPLSGLSDTVFMSSRDGVRFNRQFMETFIRPGLDQRNWIDRANMTAWGILPTAVDELSLYVTRHFHQDSIHLQRFILRTDGFASLHAPYTGGECLTRPLVFSGSRLSLNFSTSAVGSIRVELQEIDGAPIPGYGLADCHEIYGDELERLVEWAGNPSLDVLAGRPVRLRFALFDCDMFSFQFQGDSE